MERIHYLSPFLSKAAKPSGQLNFIDKSGLATLGALQSKDDNITC